jgi:hypothetical protein
MGEVGWPPGVVIRNYSARRQPELLNQEREPAQGFVGGDGLCQIEERLRVRRPALDQGADCPKIGFLLGHRSRDEPLSERRRRVDQALPG